MGKNLVKIDPYAEREAQKYEHPIPSREFILEFLAERGRPATHKQVIRELKLMPEQEEAMRRRLIAMTRDGQLHQNRRGAYGILSKMELIAGRVISHKDGFGFVVPDEGGEDLFVNARQMRMVFHGDRVLARLSNIDYRGRREATIVEVIERATNELVGRLFYESGTTFVEPANPRITQEILIPPTETLGAKQGQMVVVAITLQPTLKSRPMGKVVEILGDHMAPGMEIEVAIRNHSLPYVWPEEVLREAKKFPSDVLDEELKGRKDLRHLPFVTIDGEDAKDFDDAVYCESRQKKGWVLYVAIADVSHYVSPHSALDKEAFVRGNSVYFPKQVIPMLPESLSNELCSLNPFVNRLTMVCEMTITPAGKISRYRFCEAVIRSHARLTYTQVNAMVVLRDEALSKKFADLLPHLQELFVLYRILHKARVHRGAIDFDLPETKIIFGKNRKIERIVPLIRNDAHRMIEECMLCANISAAHFLLENDSQSLFRVHEGPSVERLQILKQFLTEVGLKLPGRSAKPTPRDYAQLLTQITGRADAHLIQTVLLRSLSQAVYSMENKGHFGLAFDAYTHFTSPIRRYPDLIVHRLIRQVLQRKTRQKKDPAFEKLGEHCSMTERRADEATREVMNWLKCEFMLDKVGEEFKGVISGVTGFGFFVELADIYAEGLVHLSTLPNDYYRFDALKHTIYGERSGRRFRLGDSIKVQVARVNLDECQIDFVLVEKVKTMKTTKATKKNKKKKDKR